MLLEIENDAKRDGGKMMKQLALIVSAAMLFSSGGLCPAVPFHSKDKQAEKAEEKKDATTTAKPLAYLMIVQKVQDTMEVRGHGRGNALPGRKTGKQLEDLGFESREVIAFSPELTLEYLKQFNVVILGAGGEGNQHSLLSDLANEKARGILEYVRQGGGLLVLRNPGWQFGKEIQEHNEWLDPMGLEILDEQVVDDENVVELPSKHELFWTDNITKHPVTESVEGVFYPNVQGSIHRYTDFSSPVKVSPDWTILVRGAKTARTVHRKKGSVIHPLSPGTYETVPPIMAVRDFGKGRIAVFPVASTCYWQDGYHVLWDGGLIMEGETGKKKGSGARLLANLFAYLSEPSKGSFGGYAPKPSTMRTHQQRMQPLDWDAIRMSGIQRKHCYVGLIGAKSELSSGRGKPLEFIQTAKEAGYDFIAFAEDLGQLTAERFAALEQICKANSDKQFKAYPGYTYLDDSGNMWVTFSDKLTWPQPGWFSTKFQGRISCNNALIRGCGKPPVILTQSHRNPEAPWFQGNFNAMALFTYRNGEQVDSSLDHYRRLVRMSFRATPVAIHFVDAPEHVKRARESGFQTYVRWFDDNIIEAFTGFGPQHKGRPVFRWSSFVSEGPIIEDVRVANSGTTDLARIGADRCRMYLRVSSPAGLKLVVIHDGERKRPWRRFLPQGQKTFEHTTDFYHDRQHDFVPVVTDQNGKKAIGWHTPTRVQAHSFVRCSDNYNTMQRGKWWGEPGDMLNIRGFENYLVVRNFEYCGTLVFAGLDETNRAAIEYYPTLACRFGGIVDTLIDEHYPPEASGNPDHTDVPFCAKKNEYLSGNVRYVYYTCRQDSSLIELVQGDYEVLKDFSARDNLIFRANGRAGTHSVSAALADGRFLAGQFTRNKRHFAGTLAERGFGVLFPNAFLGSVGFIPLQPDLRFTSHTNADMHYGNIYLRLPQGKTKFKQGEKIRYEYIGVVGPLGGAPDNGFMNDIIHSLGLHGAPAYHVQPTQGTIEDTEFILTLNTTDYGFSAKVQEAHLPLELPVRIAGLNPRWDTGILYKGEATRMIPEWVIDEFDQRYVARRQRKATNEILRFPVLDDGTGFLQIDTEVGDKDVYIGNLLVSDNPDVYLTLVNTRPGKAAFEVHNPTDTAVSCCVHPAPGFSLLGSFTKDVTVPAGTSMYIEIPADGALSGLRSP